jgi:hypothetical protein
MLQLDKISVKQILVFSEIVSESSLLQQDFIKKQYLRSASNFDQTVELLHELDLVEIPKDEIVIKPKYKELLKNLGESQKPKEVIKKFIINCFVDHKTSFSDYLNEFLSRFYLANKQYEFTPSVSERLRYSGLRNFLIDLGFIYLDSDEKKYIAVGDYSSVFAELKKTYKLPPGEFLKIRHEKEKLGKAAELKIIEYEGNRLLEFPYLAKQIEHTAKYDVSAGYDIKSYEIPNQKNCYIPRYIEVKAVSIVDYQFSWSRNEVEKSEVFRQSYYLYLLPVKGKNEFDINHLKIINDPYISVLNNKEEWIKTFESLGFSLAPDIKNKNEIFLEKAGPRSSNLIN